MANLLSILGTPTIGKSYPNGADVTVSAVFDVKAPNEASLNAYYGGNWNNDNLYVGEYIAIVK